MAARRSLPGICPLSSSVPVGLIVFSFDPSAGTDGVAAVPPVHRTDVVSPLAGGVTPRPRAGNAKNEGSAGRSHGLFL